MPLAWVRVAHHTVRMAPPSSAIFVMLDPAPAGALSALGGAGTLGAGAWREWHAPRGAPPVTAQRNADPLKPQSDSTSAPATGCP